MSQRSTTLLLRLLGNDPVLDLFVGRVGDDLPLHQLVLGAIRTVRDDLRRIGFADAGKRIELVGHRSQAELPAEYAQANPASARFVAWKDRTIEQTDGNAGGGECAGGCGTGRSGAHD